MINWSDSRSLAMINPRWPKSIKDQFLKEKEKLESRFESHLWVPSSGTTRQSGDPLKWVGLKKSVFLNAAERACSYLNVKSNDKWLLSLPEFHVSGLSIFARSEVSGCEVVSSNQTIWDAHQFIDICEIEEVSWVSLVPAQLFDLLEKNWQPSAKIKGLLIGGDFTPPSLLRRAINLGCPLFISYGLSESAAMIAGSEVNEDNLDLCEFEAFLPNQISIDKKNNLWIESQDLFTEYAYLVEQGWEFHDPKEGNKFCTNDRVEWGSDGKFRILGRQQGQIKILGEKVDVYQLDQLWIQLVGELSPQATLVAHPHARNGYEIHLVTQLNAHQISQVVQSFNSRVAPYEKIKNVVFTKQVMSKRCTPFFT